MAKPEKAVIREKTQEFPSKLPGNFELSILNKGMLSLVAGILLILSIFIIRMIFMNSSEKKIIPHQGSSPVISVSEIRKNPLPEPVKTEVTKPKKTRIKASSRRHVRKSSTRVIEKSLSNCDSRLSRKFRKENWEGLVECSEKILKLRGILQTRNTGLQRNFKNMLNELIEIFLLRSEAHFFQNPRESGKWLSRVHKLQEFQNREGLGEGHVADELRSRADGISEKMETPKNQSS